MQNFSFILDALRDGILVTNTNAEIEFVNTEACRILEVSPEQVMGISLETILGSEHIATTLVHSVIDTGRSAGASEQIVERRFGDDMLVQITVTPLLDARARMLGVVLALSDESMKSSLQRVAAEKERLTAFGGIASGIAHEVRNPLGGIRGAAELLGMQASDAKSKATAALIVREVDRITTLVDDLMVFARTDALQLELLNLHRVLDDVLELLAHDSLSRGMTLKRVYDPSLPEFLADRARLTQVFHNLCRNALQAMQNAPGTLTVTTRLGFHHHISKEGKRLAMVEIEIHNTGAYISEEMLEHVLTPFFTTRPQGTGLGLPIANHWINRHGGLLQIRSHAETGTTVLIALPLKRQ